MASTSTQLTLVGCQYRDGKVPPNTNLTLRRQPNNAEDSNAIAVYRGANIVGFVKATEAAGISPHWDMLNAQLLGQNKKMICTAVMLGGNRFGGDISATFSKAAL